MYVYSGEERNVSCVVRSKCGKKPVIAHKIGELKRSLLTGFGNRRGLRRSKKPLWETTKPKHRLPWSSQDVGDSRAKSHYQGKSHTAAREVCVLLE